MHRILVNIITVGYGAILNYLSNSRQNSKTYFPDSLKLISCFTILQVTEMKNARRRRYSRKLPPCQVMQHVSICVNAVWGMGGLDLIVRIVLYGRGVKPKCYVALQDFTYYFRNVDISNV